MSLISDTYKNRLINSNLSNLLNKLKFLINKNNLLYVLRIDNDFFKNFICFLRKNFIIDIIVINNNDDNLEFDPFYENILILSFFQDIKIFEQLQNKKQNIYDVFRVLPLEIAFFNSLEAHKLWMNIKKLENNLSLKDINIIIKMDLTKYSELFYFCLKKAKLVNEKTLVVLHNSYFYKDTFGDLFKYLNNTLILTDDINNLVHKNCFYGIYYCKEYNYFNYFFSTTLLPFPKNAKIVLLKHSIIDDPNPFVQDIFVHKKLNFTLPNIVITSSKLFKQGISLGYPKLDFFIKEYKKQKKDSTNIMIATSSFAGVFQDINPIITNNNFLILLINKFFKNKIILRPHPNIFKNKNVLNLIKRLQRYENFEFDNSLSYIKSFSETKVFISDGLSSSAYTYAFSTLKPVLFYIPNKTAYQLYYGKSTYYKFLTKIGDIAFNETQLITLTKKYLKNKNFYNRKKNSIRLLRNLLISNIGSSSLVISEYIQNYILLTSKKEESTLKKLYSPIFKKNSNSKIVNFFDSFKGKQLVIYGAGEHFNKIFIGLYNFENLNIKYFSDSNKKLIDSEIFGKSIIPKDKINKNYTIIISSFKYEQIIKEELLKEFDYVIPFYETQLHNFILTLSDEDKYFEDYKLYFYQLWDNINKIEALLNPEQIKYLLECKFINYYELFNEAIKLLNIKEINFVKYGNEKFYLTNCFYQYDIKGIN